MQDLHMKEYKAEKIRRRLRETEKPGPCKEEARAAQKKALRRGGVKTASDGRTGRQKKKAGRR